MNGLAGYYVSTIGKPHEYFDLTPIEAEDGVLDRGCHRQRFRVHENAAPLKPDIGDLFRRLVAALVHNSDRGRELAWPRLASSDHLAIRHGPSDA